MLPDSDGPHTGRCARKEQISHLQCHETADVCDEVIHPVQHVSRMSLLHGAAVNVQMKIQLLHITANLLQGHKTSNSRRTIETFGEFPRQASGTETALQVTGREVDGAIHLPKRQICTTTSASYCMSDEKSGKKKGLPSRNKAESGFIKITGSLLVSLCPNSRLCWA